MNQTIDRHIIVWYCKGQAQVYGDLAHTDSLLSVGKTVKEESVFFCNHFALSLNVATKSKIKKAGLSGGADYKSHSPNNSWRMQSAFQLSTRYVY